MITMNHLPHEIAGLGSTGLFVDNGFDGSLWELAISEVLQVAHGLELCVKARLIDQTQVFLAHAKSLDVSYQQRD
jgi:hypothetical protein